MNTDVEDFVRFADKFPQAMLLVSSQGNILAANQQSSRLFELSKHHLIGHPLSDFSELSDLVIIERLEGIIRTSDVVPLRLGLNKRSLDISSPIQTRGFLYQAASAECDAQILLYLNAQSHESVLNPEAEPSHSENKDSRLQQLQETLDQKASQLDAILTHSSAIIYIKDVSGRYLEANAHYGKVLDKSVDDIVGKTDYELFPKEIADPFVKNDKRVIQTGRNLEVEEIGPGPDGIHHYISVKFPIYNADDDIIGTGGISTDITAHVKLKKKLENQQDQLLAAQHIGHMGHWELDPVTQQAKWSDEIFKIMGLPKSECVGPEFLNQHVHEQDRERVLASLQCGTQTGQKHNEEYRIVRPDGEIRWVRCEAENIKEPESQLYRLKGIFQDITEQKVIQLALQASKEQYQRILDTAATSIVIVDKDGVITDINAYHLAQIGKGKNQKSDYLGKNILKHPCVVNANMVAWYQRVLAGVPSEKKAAYFPTTTGGMDGTFNIKGAPLMVNGEITGAVFVHEDITERKKEQEIVLKSQQHLVEAQRIANIGSWELDLQSQQLIWSDEIYQLFEIDPDTFSPSYESFLNAVHPEDRERVDEAYTYSVKTKTPYNIRHRLQMPDGRIKHVQESCKTYYDEKGLPLRSIGAVQDITEMVDMEEKLQHTQKMDALGQLTGGIAHDYNNMLGVIMGYTELLQLKLANDDSVQGYLKHIEEATERGKSMTEKLLAFSRKKAGNPQRVDVKTAIENDQELLAKSLTAAVTLTLDLNDKLWPIRVDISEFQNLLLNMAINSQHAMPNGGVFSIQAKNVKITPKSETKYQLKAGDYVLLIITDTGIGMDRKTTARVFEPFFSTKGEKGTGLGLSQVFGFVKRSGGNILVTSQVGRGTEFHVLFPRFQQNIDENQITRLDTNDIIKSGNECILIVDDEAALRLMAAEILTAYGYQVLLAESGQEALTVLAKNEDIQLMLSDIIMPNMNGLELARRVKQDYPDVLVQLVSGFSGAIPMDPNQEDLLKTTLRKPYRKDELLKRIRELLDNPAVQQSTHTASLHQLVQWSESMSTGIEKIDYEHKKLIRLINQAIQLDQKQTDSKAIQSILDELLAYTEYHFQHEEAVMKQLAYPHLNKHQQVHHMLIQEVKQRIQQFNQGTLVINDLIAFLSAWLQDHIMGMDKYIVSESNVKKAND